MWADVWLCDWECQSVCVCACVWVSFTVLSRSIVEKTKKNLFS